MLCCDIKVTERPDAKVQFLNTDLVLASETIQVVLHSAVKPDCDILAVRAHYGSERLKGEAKWLN